MSHQIVDLLIVGGGPAGLAAALRGRELGLEVLILEADNLMRRIRDYSKDKLILPGFGGGDRMAFPDGGEWIAKLPFEPIDKDDLVDRWRTLCQQAKIVHRTGQELTGLEDGPDDGSGDGGSTFIARVYDHNDRRDVAYQARHVALALGRGVPRRFEIPGETTGIALRLDDPQRFLGHPVCVVGGGTSAAEAVIALSNAKAEARDPTAVHWSYRGDRLPRVSKALAETFFSAYAGHGNIRYHPHSEPLMVCQSDDRRPQLAIRVDRRQIDGRAVETTLLEFPVEHCIACIGEDVPESFLAGLGISMATGGPKNRKRMVVNTRLETRRARVYLLGDLLSQAYFETDDFDADPSSFREVRHRGNIKSAVRDGVLVAQVVRQRLDGVGDALLDLRVRELEETIDAGPMNDVSRPIAVPRASVKSPDAVAWLVRLFASGAETEEHPLSKGVILSLGREGCDLSFPDDEILSPRHASIAVGSDGIVLRDDGSTNGVFLQLPSERKITLQAGDLLRAGRQFLVIERSAEGWVAVHYDAAGAERHRFGVATGPLILGRETLDKKDGTLSRRQLALTIENRRLLAKDLLSSNGTFLRVQDSVRLQNGDRFLVGQQRFALSDRPDAVIELGPRRALARQAPRDGLLSREAVAGEEQPLGLLEADAVGPDRGRRDAPHARGRVADLGAVLDHQQVRAQRHVGAAGDAEAVDLADDRLVAVEQAHEAADVPRHHLVVHDRIPVGARLVVARLHAEIEG